jgi:ubiquinone/menaquinone biosynthesis C-methylase UbiE
MNESDKKILNVGCGEDKFGTHFIDLYPTRKEIKSIDVNKDRFPFPDNYFDEIFSGFLFEHLVNPIHFLNECYRVLKGGGRLTILTDNAGFFGIFTDTHYGGYEKRRAKEGFTEDRHYSLFTPNHLKNWLEYAGFKDIKIEYGVYSLEKKRIRRCVIPFVKIFAKIISFFCKRLSMHIKIVGVKC